MKRVLVGGAFNVIHPGHIFFLIKAKSLGDFLIVVVANDNNVLKNKGYLLFSAEERKMILENLKIVDKVVIGDKSDFLRVVEKEKPDIIALGYDQKINEKDLREKLKSMKIDCKVVRIKEKFGNYSTKNFLEKIIENLKIKKEGIGQIRNKN
jgi:FAD synthetase